jgi:hypothetical protein
MKLELHFEWLAGAVFFATDFYRERCQIATSGERQLKPCNKNTKLFLDNINNYQ